jgi:hypothetical protein
MTAIGTALAEQPLHFQGIGPQTSDISKMIDKEKTDIMPC